jgi:carboxymethylenebutenolidase
MCHGTNARPPRPPIAGGAGDVRDGDLVLTARDGARIGAYGARADHVGGAGVVILPDVRGLHQFYRELAFRFAEAGIHACAIDYFGRTAGIGPREDDFDFGPHIKQTRDATIAMDVGAAVRHLRSTAGGAARAAFTVGCCFGGRNSFNQAARGLGLAGVIGFYGRVVRHPGDREDTALELADRYTCPVLGLFGGADRSIPREDIEAFRVALHRAGVRNELVVYEGAPHSFFDRSKEPFDEACEDAWSRVLSFIERGTAEAASTEGFRA